MHLVGVGGNKELGYKVRKYVRMNLKLLVNYGLYKRKVVQKNKPSFVSERFRRQKFTSRELIVLQSLGSEFLLGLVRALVKITSLYACLGLYSGTHRGAVTCLRQFLIGTIGKTKLPCGFRPLAWEDLRMYLMSTSNLFSLQRPPNCPKYRIIFEHAGTSRDQRRHRCR